jgi:hypothetical protein
MRTLLLLLLFTATMFKATTTTDQRPNRELNWFFEISETQQFAILDNLKAILKPSEQLLLPNPYRKEINVMKEKLMNEMKISNNNIETLIRISIAKLIQQKNITNQQELL